MLNSLEWLSGNKWTRRRFITASCANWDIEFSKFVTEQKLLHPLPEEFELFMDTLDAGILSSERGAMVLKR